VLLRTNPVRCFQKRGRKRPRSAHVIKTRCRPPIRGLSRFAPVSFHASNSQSPLISRCHLSTTLYSFVPKESYLSRSYSRLVLYCRWLDSAGQKEAAQWPRPWPDSFGLPRAACFSPASFSLYLSLTYAIGNTTRSHRLLTNKAFRPTTNNTSTGKPRGFPSHKVSSPSKTEWKEVFELLLFGMKCLLYSRDLKSLYIAWHVPIPPGRSVGPAFSRAAGRK